MIGNRLVVESSNRDDAVKRQNSNLIAAIKSKQRDVSTEEKANRTIITGNKVSSPRVLLDTEQSISHLTASQEASEGHKDRPDADAKPSKNDAQRAIKDFSMGMKGFPKDPKLEPSSLLDDPADQQIKEEQKSAKNEDAP